MPAYSATVRFSGRVQIRDGVQNRRSPKIGRCRVRLPRLTHDVPKRGTERDMPKKETVRLLRLTESKTRTATTEHAHTRCKAHYRMQQKALMKNTFALSRFLKLTGGAAPAHAFLRNSFTSSGKSWRSCLETLLESDVHSRI